ncbi:MAG: hypothetical protein U9N36_09785 [Euryarchaeota archaeon]|nr:hypothetical protein [Euryarchaeota archaeon]
MNGCRILAITVLLALIFSMTAAAETTNVTIGTDEHIALNNDIYIEVLDVSANGISHAKVWFYSYQDSVGIMANMTEELRGILSMMGEECEKYYI